MQTHSDGDSSTLRDLLAKLEPKAKRMTEQRENLITAGNPGEEPLADVRGRHFFVRQLPDDEHGVLRISLGEALANPDTAYFTFRGDPRAIQKLIDRAAVDIRQFIAERE